MNRQIMVKIKEEWIAAPVTDNTVEKSAQWLHAGYPVKWVPLKVMP